ncbi:helix-turn-helix domain-containing protein [Mesorhizobium sp.]|uniref:transposase n=1 Tax=Mesorhizobium sp. TaxID=1871066 RepID=UPI00257C76AF|nr:helix-turn-helix domain-containing protein [Mesorhizobium sp.]
MQNGENVSRLADELGIHRQRLYAWREQLRTCGNLMPSLPGAPKEAASRGTARSASLGGRFCTVG